MPIDKKRILNRKQIYKITEGNFEAFVRKSAVPSTAFVYGVMMVVFAYLFPQFVDFLFLSTFILLSLSIYYYSENKFCLPIRLPTYAKFYGFSKDIGDPRPGSRQENFEYSAFEKPQGIMYMGADIEGNEVWLKSKDVCTHMLIFGTTGAGKTVAMQALSWCTLTFGSGFVYVDPKASPSLQFEFGLMCRRMGIDDNFRLLNFLLDKTVGEQQKLVTDDPVSPSKVSNSLNALASGVGADIVTMFSSLLGKAEGPNAVFQEKAETLLQAITPLLVALRDAKQIELSMSCFRNFLDPDQIVGLVYPLDPEEENILKQLDEFKKKGLEENNTSRRNAGQPLLNKLEVNELLKKAEEVFVVKYEKDGIKMPLCIKYRRFFTQEQVDILKQFIKSVNFVEGKGLKEQDQNFFDQYTYARSYFVKALTLMSGSYAHIFNVSAGEVDFMDVLLNNRVLVVMLPSMQKSEEETATLGKIILSQIRNAVSIGLGSKAEGTSDIVLETLVSKSRVPMPIQVDEYAAIATPGFAIVLTQSRSLGFAAIVGTQDFKGLKKADEGEAGQILSNTNIKLFMSIRDPKDTYEIIKEYLDKEKVEEKDLENPDNRGRIVEIDQISFSEVSEQIEGEYFCLFKKRPIVGSLPLYVPSTKNQLHRLVRMIDPVRPQIQLIDSILDIQYARSDAVGMIIKKSLLVKREEKALKA